MKRFAKLFSLIVLVCLLIPAIALGAEYPKKEVELVVPWSAGGATDLLFRAVASVYPKYANNQPLLIKNVPGGGAVPGVLEFMKGKSDGYTLLGMATPIVTKIHMSKVPFDINSFEPVVMLVENPCMIIVNVNSPYKTLPEFVAAAKKNPGKISIGNGGAGGGTHLAALAFEDFVGAEYLHVPFQGGGPSVTALVGGHIDAIMGSAPEGLTNVDAGQLRILGVFGDTRLEKYPNVTTAKEQGIDFQIAMWRGVCAPKGTPASVIKEIHDIMVKCMADPEFIKLANDLGIQLVHKDAAGFGQYMLAEDKLYEKLIKNKKLGDRY